jgi:phosphoenolpyruvate synthase/pyruvate phosphate dikinase
MAERFHFIGLKQGYSLLEDTESVRDEIGGKAHGLFSIRNAVNRLDGMYPGIQVDIPSLTVLGTSVFDAFMERNELAEIANSNLPDDRIAFAFQNADMPFEVLGELRKLITEVTVPLAVRSSGLLEDTTRRPFAGVYATKMIPNNQPDLDIRFRKLLEAIKYVWASTYFKVSKDYCLATGLECCQEKMAVILQEMVGKNHSQRYYPELAGVARSFNYYPIKPAKPQDGVVDLALGLGKTIVDGGKTWTYSPAFSRRPPPFETVDEIFAETQNEFWAVNMGEPPEYNPVKETEFMQLYNLQAAEADGMLRYVASTYDAQSDRFSVGVAEKGPRAITFAPLLAVEELPFNRVVKSVLAECAKDLDTPVEIEFAMTFNPHHFAVLQVRPMVIPSGNLDVTDKDLNHRKNLAASELVLGNGMVDTITDVVYVKPDKFELNHTRRIAEELEAINRILLSQNKPYILIVFGRLGTFDSWLGIPVAWGQVCGAKVIVEATQENVKVELSQGSHYFHNLINLGVLYFSMPFTSSYRLDWKWLVKQKDAHDMEFIRHIETETPFIVKVDGRSGRGVICRPD